jgi:hypothetical protein
VEGDDVSVFVRKQPVAVADDPHGWRPDDYIARTSAPIFISDYWKPTLVERKSADLPNATTGVVLQDSFTRDPWLPNARDLTPKSVSDSSGREGQRSGFITLST